MSKTQKLERIRAALSHLQPLLDQCRDEDTEINRILTALCKLEARVEYADRQRR